MEKTILDAKNIWNPFQIYPTNLLQFVIDYKQILARGGSSSDITALIEKHKAILSSDIGIDQLYATAAMAGPSTVLR